MGKDSYEGPAAGLRAESAWLAVEDLEVLLADRGPDLVVTITEVKRYREATFDEGLKKYGVGALCFEGHKKELIINATRRKSMIHLYGKATREWRGKSIALYIDATVKMKGKTVGGIRIRPSAPRPSAERQGVDEARATYERLRSELYSMTEHVMDARAVDRDTAQRLVTEQAEITLSGRPNMGQLRKLIGATAALLAKRSREPGDDEPPDDVPLTVPINPEK